MNASSESGLWALTISRAATSVIDLELSPVYNTALSGLAKTEAENEKGRSSVGL